MPLTMAQRGKEIIIKKVGGNPDTKRFLESLGFVAGSEVTVVSENAGDMIVNIKEARIAISREMAKKIIV